MPELPERQPQNNRRSPYGERGLKLTAVCREPQCRKSLPLRGAWIEISPMWEPRRQRQVAPLTGSVD